MAQWEGLSVGSPRGSGAVFSGAQLLMNDQKIWESAVRTLKAAGCLWSPRSTVSSH